MKRLNELTVPERRFLKWVTRQPCVICAGGTYHSDTGEWLCDPCHVKSRGSRGQVHFDNVIPMCRAHHVIQHTAGWDWMKESYGINGERLAIETTKRWLDDVGQAMESPRETDGESNGGQESEAGV